MATFQQLRADIPVTHTLVSQYAFLGGYRICAVMAIRPAYAQNLTFTDDSGPWRGEESIFVCIMWESLVQNKKPGATNFIFILFYWPECKFVPLNHKWQQQRSGARRDLGPLLKKKPKIILFVYKRQHIAFGKVHYYDWRSMENLETIQRTGLTSH